MAELRKRLNSGWVLMDCVVGQDDCITYFLERATHRCIVEVDKNGYGRIVKR